MTGFGKFLAMMNILVSITMLSWTLSAYVNRLDWVDTKNAEGANTPGQISRFKKEVDDLQKLVVDAHNQYGVQANSVATVESTRYFRSEELKRRMNEARGIDPKTGLPTESVFRVQRNEVGSSLTDLTAPANTLKVIQDPSDKPLRGLASLRADFDKESGIIRVIKLGKAGKLSTDEQLNTIADLPAAEFDAQVTGLGLEDLRRMHGLISDRIALADIAIVKQKEIRANLREQAVYLADKKINWLAELQALEIRSRQLQDRLKFYAGK
jgi:hypothetical protein